MGAADHTMESDPYSLSRFVRGQSGCYATALAEIRSGRKRSHWMWFVFPQFHGLGQSETSRLYSIKSLEEARAYLAHPVLGRRLAECAEAALGVEGLSALRIFGSPDHVKLRSSATLFAHISPAGSVFHRLLAQYFPDGLDEETLRLVIEDEGQRPRIPSPPRRGLQPSSGLLNVQRLRVGLRCHATRYLNFDFSTFAIDDRKKLVSDGHFVFYNNRAAADGSICLVEEPEEGDDDALLEIDLSRVDPRADQIIVCASLWSLGKDEADFGGTVFNVRLTEKASGEEIVTASISGQYEGSDVVDLCRLCRSKDAWGFEALGRGRRGGLESLLNAYT